MDADGSGGRAAVATLGVVAATAVVTWCLIGPLSETPLPGQELDYSVRAPEVDRWIELVVAVLAIVATVVLGWVVDRARSTRRAEAMALVVLAIVLAGSAGAVAGGGGRILTAGSVGANIGGGLALIFALPTTLVLSIVAVVVAARSAKPLLGQA